MVGAGVRALSQNTSLFEKIMNTIHQKAPSSSKICFNTNPADTVEAILRWVNSDCQKVIHWKINSTFDWVLLTYSLLIDIWDIASAEDQLTEPIFV
jgi:hypothetical protein